MAKHMKIGVPRRKDRDADHKALEEFLARGGKIQKIPDSREIDKMRKIRKRKEATGKVSLFTEQEIFNKESNES